MLNASSRLVFRSRARRARAVCASIGEKSRRVENPYFLDVSGDSEKFLLPCCVIVPRNVQRTRRPLVGTQHVVSLYMRRCSINRKHWFFCRAVVIRMQCSRSPRALLRLRHSLRLGGQHGEEAKDEDEVSGEKGREEDEAPEEEVSTRCFPVFDFERRR